MTNAYSGREQTQAKHFILKRYLQELAFKVLNFSDISYIDGFSGPWETKTDNFSDSSFMIALNVLQDAQEKIRKSTGKLRRIRCFFSENNPTAFSQLESAVNPFHNPDKKFEIKTYCGKFEDAIKEIELFASSTLPLIFIDPTGWTGYSLQKIKPLFSPRKCEVLINFMFDHINRFSNSSDEATIASLEKILGENWRNRLDTELDHGSALIKLFREELKATGDFESVIATNIDKTTAKRTHFFVVYGTKDPSGLIAFREIEYRVLRDHAKNLANVQERKKEEKSGMVDMFAESKIAHQELSVDEKVSKQKAMASKALVERLETDKEAIFSEVVVWILQNYMLRKTNVKDICIDLAHNHKIENTWGTNKKPQDQSLIKLKIS